jgi:hypothetical protein
MQQCASLQQDHLLGLRAGASAEHVVADAAGHARHQLLIGYGDSGGCSPYMNQASARVCAGTVKAEQRGSGYLFWRKQRMVA